MTIFHPGKPGWNVYVRIFQPDLPRSRQASQPAFSYKWTEIWTKKTSISRDHEIKSRNFTGHFRVAVPFVSQERRGFESSNFTVLFLFVPLKAFQKMGFPKQVVGSFTNGFSGPKSFRDFRETGPNYLQNKTSRLEYHIRRTYRKCKNKITMFKNLEHSYFIFTLSIRASNVILEAWCLILQVVLVIQTHP